MSLLNKTKNVVIEENVKIAKGFFGKVRGLMFESKKKFDYALVFDMQVESRVSTSIHCLFVFFPIDVIYLDKNRHVVDVAKNVAPFTLFYAPKKPARYFIEVRKGKGELVSFGDEVAW